MCRTREASHGLSNSLNMMLVIKVGEILLGCTRSQRISCPHRSKISSNSTERTEKSSHALAQRKIKVLDLTAFY